MSEICKYKLGEVRGDLQFKKKYVTCQSNKCYNFLIKINYNISLSKSQLTNPLT